MVEAGVCRKFTVAAVPTVEVVLNISKPPMRLSELRGGDMVLLNIGSVLMGRLTVAVVVA